MAAGGGGTIWVIAEIGADGSLAKSSGEVATLAANARGGSRRRSRRHRRCGGSRGGLEGARRRT